MSICARPLRDHVRTKLYHIMSLHVTTFYMYCVLLYIAGYMIDGWMDLINCSGVGLPRYLSILLCFLCVNSVEDSGCFHYS